MFLINMLERAAFIQHTTWISGYVEDSSGQVFGDSPKVSYGTKSQELIN